MQLSFLDVVSLNLNVSLVYLLMKSKVLNMVLCSPQNHRY